MKTRTFKIRTETQMPISYFIRFNPMEGESPYWQYGHTIAFHPNSTFNNVRLEMTPDGIRELQKSLKAVTMQAYKSGIMCSLFPFRIYITPEE